MAGGTAYAVAFTALGVVTSRALVVGLGYTLLWEGVLAGLLEGTRFLSIRQATLGVAAALTARTSASNRSTAHRRRSSSSWRSSSAGSAWRPSPYGATRSARRTSAPDPWLTLWRNAD